MRPALSILARALLCAALCSLNVRSPLSGAHALSSGGGDVQLKEGCEMLENGVEHCIDKEGFHRALTDGDFAQIYKDNIDADFAYWRAKGRQLKVADIVMPALVQHPLTVLFVIKGNKVHLLKNQGMASYAGTRVDRMAIVLQKNIDEFKLDFPNTIFIYNAEDLPPCSRRGPDKGCTVPVFTIYKRWAGSASEDTEVALPHFGRTFGELFNFPWEKKQPTALLRARLQKSMSSKSTRLKLSELAGHDPEAAKRLDAGIVENRRRGEVSISKEARRHYVPIQQHTRWKFLINTEGHVASSRLGQLLMMNSVIVTEESKWIEYYYRSLKEGEHYINFNVENVMEVLTKIQAPEEDSRMRRIANASQHFGHRYLSNHGKTMYTRQALIQYNTLFKDMDSFMASFDPMGGPGGSKIDVGQTIMLLLNVSNRSANVNGGGRRSAGGTGRGGGGGGGSGGGKKKHRRRRDVPSGEKGQ